jgi:MFS transporter, ACS family, allantoate permease
MIRSQPQEELTKTLVILSCFSSVINGFCSWVVGQIPATAIPARWQYLIFLTGSVNVCWSLFVLWFLPDTPMNAKFLTEEDKYYAVVRLAQNRTGIQHRVWKWSQVREAIFDLKLLLIFLFNFAINIPNGGLITFGSIIIKNLDILRRRRPC